MLDLLFLFILCHLFDILFLSLCTVFVVISSDISHSPIPFLAVLTLLLNPFIGFLMVVIVVFISGDSSGFFFQTCNVTFYKFPFSEVIFVMFILFLRGRGWAWTGKGQREGDRIWSKLCTTSREPQCGAWTHKLQDHDLSWNQESDV